MKKKKRKEDSFGMRLPARWIGQPSHPKFAEKIAETMEDALATASTAPIPASPEWYSENSQDSHLLTALAAGNKGLSRAVRGVHILFSVNHVLHRCKEAGVREDHECIRGGIRELAKAQRLLMQACLWLQDEDVKRLVDLPVPERLERQWIANIRGALAAACVAKALIEADVEVRYADPDTDVRGIDLLVPSFPGIGPLAVQVKSRWLAKTRIIPINDPKHVWRQLGLGGRADNALMDQIASTHQSVAHLNRRLGTGYTALLVMIGGLDTDRPMSEMVKALVGEMPKNT